MGSSQRLPRIMRAWGRMRNFIILKKYVALRVNGSRINNSKGKKAFKYPL